MNRKSASLVVVLAVAALVAVEILPALMTAPLGPGIDAVTAATKKSKSSKSYTSHKSGSSGAPAPVVIETSEGIAQFIQWQQGVDLGKPVLLLEVAPAVGQGTATLVVPNASEKDTTVNPQKEIASLASQVRIGDLLRVTFTRSAGKFLVVDLASEKSAADATPPPPFTFNSIRTVQVDNESYLAVSLRRKLLTWTFLLDNKEKGSKPSPEELLAKAVAKFKSGDLVNIEYNLRDYQFYLTRIAPAPLSGRGTFVRSGKDVQKDQVMPTAVVQFSGGTMTLRLPPQPAQPAAYGEAPAADEVPAPLKGVRPGQAVEFKYHREGGTLWLDEIVVSAGQ
jgi:hypothetical protein